MTVIVKAHARTAPVFGIVIDMPTSTTYTVRTLDGKTVVVHDSLIKKFHM